METYELLSEGFRIQYPSDWVVLDEQQERPTIVSFVSPLEDSSDNYREPFNILKFIYDHVFTFEDFAKSETNELAKNSNITIIQTEQITISSRPFLKLIF